MTQVAEPLSHALSASKSSDGVALAQFPLGYAHHDNALIDTVDRRSIKAEA